MFRFIIPILSALFVSIAACPVKAATFHFSFTNTANGGGIVTGTVVLGATTFATSVTVDTNTAGFGIGQYVWNPGLFANDFTVVSGEITSAAFNYSGLGAPPGFVSCCSLTLLLGNPSPSSPTLAGLTNSVLFVAANTDTGLTFTPVVTPLPAALPLFATGLGALGLLGWRRNKKAASLNA